MAPRDGRPWPKRAACSHAGARASSPTDASAAAPSDRGQATIEFALALPIIAVILLATVQVGISIRNELAVELAAREGARAAVVTPDASGAADAAARRAVALPIQVATTSKGADVTVTVSYVDETDVALIGWALGAITHTATVTMAIEPP